MQANGRENVFEDGGGITSSPASKFLREIIRCRELFLRLRITLNAPVYFARLRLPRGGRDRICEMRLLLCAGIHTGDAVRM